MNDLEAARYISEALNNLPVDYPHKDMAHRAYGQLILGELGLQPMNGYAIQLPYKGSRWHKGSKWFLVKELLEVTR